jgi:predicted aldo/keto reductase-like oxidoreductase
MKSPKTVMKRRKFLASIGAVTIGSFLPWESAIGNVTRTPGQSPFPQVPKRTLGKSGVEIPILGLGTTFDLREKQALLATCSQYGLFFDTAWNYATRNAEAGLGIYFKNNPEAKEKAFKVTKGNDLSTVDPDVTVLEQNMNESLALLGVDHVNVYLGLHGANDPVQLTDKVRKWSFEMKKKGKFRMFGFSAHDNAANMLKAAAKTDFIDYALVKYSFDMMDDKEMQDGIEACYQAGIGLVSMKTQRNLSVTSELESKAQQDMAKHFLDKGYTQAQAKIKMVLEDKRFSAAIVGMPNIAELIENVAAVLDVTELADIDKNVLRKYANETCHAACKGCFYICRSAVPEVPISDIMRHLVYHNGHRNPLMAKENFDHIQYHIRKNLNNYDYSQAEAHCPQHIPITKYIAEAVKLFS